jgi:hypothetical protein
MEGPRFPTSVTGARSFFFVLGFSFPVADQHLWKFDHSFEWVNRRQHFVRRCIIASVCRIHGVYVSGNISPTLYEPVCIQMVLS